MKRLSQLARLVLLDGEIAKGAMKYEPHARAHTHTHAHTHARTHARTYARTHAHVLAPTLRHRFSQNGWPGTFEWKKKEGCGIEFTVISVLIPLRMNCAEADVHILLYPAWT